VNTSPPKKKSLEELSKNMSEYNVFKLFSSGLQGKTIGETLRNIQENMDDRFQTMERLY
jgi:hypothetical protein